jgi:imidazolonepropionase
MAGPAPRRGPAQRDVAPLADATLASLDGRIVYVGTGTAWRERVALLPGAVVIDARGRTVLPGFVDPHTHVVYAGDRRDELQRRLAGASYAEIAAGGGGIVSTVKATREASEAGLVAAARPRLEAALRQGTTTCEVKSGYGLDTASELAMLRAIRRLASLTDMELVATFMGAHEIPPEYRHDRDAYVDLVVEDMLPRVAAEGLAEWCDVFCERGVFTPAESRRILEAGRRHGLGARIHADELAASGGSQVAADVGARSADHLIFVEPDGIDALASAGVVATLLPIAAFYLKLGRYAPARALIEAGVPVALATDMNPGGGFSPSMPFAVTLGCFAMNLTLEEALVAATINAAYALDRQDRIGSLEVGKQMDAVVVDGEAVDLLHVGRPAIEHVIKRGRLVAGHEATREGGFR